MPFEGLDDFMDVLSALPEAMKGAAERGVKKALELPVLAAKQLAPGDTGQLEGSIKALPVQRNAEGIEGKMHVGAEHGIYVELGTGPVGWASDNGKAPVDAMYTMNGWVYMDPKTGDFYYTYGQPARPYLYPAWKSNEEKMLDIVAQEVGEVGGELKRL